MIKLECAIRWNIYVLFEHEPAMCVFAHLYMHLAFLCVAYNSQIKLLSVLLKWDAVKLIGLLISLIKVERCSFNCHSHLVSCHVK